jgi:hypothetical protein
MCEIFRIKHVKSITIRLYQFDQHSDSMKSETNTKEISGSHGGEYEDDCSLVEADRRFRGAYCLHHQGDDRGSKHP